MQQSYRQSTHPMSIYSSLHIIANSYKTTRKSS